MPDDPNLASTTTTPGVGMTPGPVQPPARPTPTMPAAATMDPTGGFPDWSKPSPKYEPFLPEAPRRPGLWGKPSDVLTSARNWPGTGPAPGPYMPQAQDVKGLLNDALGGLSKMGSPGIMQLAMGLRGLNANVVNAFIQGRMNRMKLEDAMFQRQMQQLILQQQGESEDYGIAFELYDKTKDPAKLQAALQRVADKYGDHDGVKAAIARGDFAWVEKVQAARDHKLGNLQKYVEQRDRIKAGEDAQKREDDYLAGGAPSAPAAPATPAGPGAAAAPGGTPSAAAPGVTTPGGTTAAPKALSPIENDSNEFEMDPSKVPLGAPNTQAVARALAGRAQEKDRQFEAIPQSVAPPGESDEARAAREKAVIDQGRRINPLVANAAQGILDGIETPTATASTKPGERLAMALAHKARPDWNRLTPTQEAARVRQEYSLGRGALLQQEKNIDGIRAVVPKNIKDINTLVQYADALDKKGSLRPIIEKWHRWLEGQYKGDPQVAAFNEQVNKVQNDVAQIQISFAAGGRGGTTVYAQKTMAELIPKGSNAAQIKRMGENLKWDYENQIVPMANEFNRDAQRYGLRIRQDVSDIVEALRRDRPVPPPMPSGGVRID